MTFRYLLKNGESYDDGGEVFNSTLEKLGFKKYEVDKDVKFSDLLGVWRDIDNCPMKSDEDKARETAQARIQEIDQLFLDLDNKSIRPERSLKALARDLKVAKTKEEKAKIQTEITKEEDKLYEIELEVRKLRKEREELNWVIHPELKPQPEPVVEETKPEEAPTPETI